MGKSFRIQKLSNFSHHFIVPSISFPFFNDKFLCQFYLQFHNIQFLMQEIMPDSSFKDIFQQLIKDTKEIEATSFGPDGQEKIQLGEIACEEVDEGCPAGEDSLNEDLKQIPFFLNEISSPQEDSIGFWGIQDNQHLGAFPENQEPISWRIKQKKKSSALKQIFSEKVFSKKNGNTIRFLIDVFIEYVPQYKQEYPEEAGQKIVDLCERTRAWHLLKKKNVYNRDHLQLFFGDQCEVMEKNSTKTRELFNKILRENALEAMQKPKSQIKDKVHYLRVAKIFALRCRNNKLSQRNQSR